MSSVINSESRRRCFKCGRSPAEDSLTTVFRFPKPGKTNTLRCELWAKYCFPDKEYWSPEFQHKLHKEHKMLCNRHFPRSSFSDYPETSKKLHRFAVPDDIKEIEPQPGPSYCQVQVLKDVTNDGLDGTTLHNFQNLKDLGHGSMLSGSRTPTQEVRNIIEEENINQAVSDTEVEPVPNNPSYSRSLTRPPTQELSDIEENINQAVSDTEVETVPNNPSYSRSLTIPPTQEHSDIEENINQAVSDTEVETVPNNPSYSRSVVNMDNFKLKLKNVLHSTKYCGICLENDDSMSNIDEELEIFVNEQSCTKVLKDIINVVFVEANYSLASTQICNTCMGKLIQSYIFIENAKETSKILEHYVQDLLSKSNDFFVHHLPETIIDGTHVIIMLKNNNQESPEKGERKNEFIKKREVQDDNLGVRKGFSSKRKKYKCEKCLLSFQSLIELRQHRCAKQILRCRLCLKTFRNKEHLNAHYKTHLKEKCQFCHQKFPKKELMEHQKTSHGISLYKCLKCELLYPLETFQMHTKSCQEIKTENPQCLMCFKTFSQEKFKSHTCKYSCPECAEIPCKHYKYLKSYREQILNNVAKLKCIDCDYVCTKKEVLLGHVNRDHLNNHPYTCDKCGQQFYSKFALKNHIQRFHDENCFVCQYCDLEFININIYESHVISCGNTKRSFACDNCPASFDSSDSLMNHVTCRHSNDIFPCGLCNKKFLKDSKRKEHMVKVHSSLQTKNREKNVECVVCQEKCDSKAELVQHMKSHEPNITYPCRICNTEYQTLRQFRAHSRKHNGPFATCHVCGKQMREILLKKHLTTHSDSVETCETCGRSFQSIALLKYHQKVHLESVPCPKCNKMINPARLRRHWRGHLSEDNPAQKYKKQQPNLKCELCEYKTWNNTLLECHMNRHHLKTKPYVCHICSKDFTGKNLLKKHIETHGMKSVVCMVCLKSFANSTCLKMHLRLHTGEKPYTCEVCGDRFRSSSIMNVHKLKKHSDKSNVCPLCSNRFFTVRDLRRHVIKVHWKQKNKRFDPRELKGLDKEHYHLFHDGRRAKVDDEEVDFNMPC